MVQLYSQYVYQCPLEGEIVHPNTALGIVYTLAAGSFPSGHLTTVLLTGSQPGVFIIKSKGF